MEIETTNEMLDIQKPVVFENSLEAVQEKTFIPLGNAKP